MNESEKVSSPRSWLAEDLARATRRVKEIPGGEADVAERFRRADESNRAEREEARLREKVSSPSAALPDVRALIADLKPVCARAMVLAAYGDASVLDFAGQVAQALDAALNTLEAALRSREGERHTSVYRMIGDREVECCSLTMRPVSEGGCPHGSREGERAEPADLDALKYAIASMVLANMKDDVWCRWVERVKEDVNAAVDKWAAAQRATPSAPTPNDLRYILPALEKAIPILRAAITDETGTADALDRLRTDLEKRAALADPSGTQEAR